jgi:hypothetical protein
MAYVIGQPVFCKNTAATRVHAFGGFDPEGRPRTLCGRGRGGLYEMVGDFDPRDTRVCEQCSKAVVVLWAEQELAGESHS